MSEEKRDHSRTSIWIPAQRDLATTDSDTLSSLCGGPEIFALTDVKQTPQDESASPEQHSPVHRL